MTLYIICCTLYDTYTYSDKKSVGSEVLNSKRFNQFLNECEESVNKLMAEIAMKFYSLGFEEGLQAAMVSRIKTVKFQYACTHASVRHA